MIVIRLRSKSSVGTGECAVKKAWRPQEAVVAQGSQISRHSNSGSAKHQLGKHTFFAQLSLNSFPEMGSVPEKIFTSAPLQQSGLYVVSYLCTEHDQLNSQSLTVTPSGGMLEQLPNSGRELEFEENPHFV
jgi:hypothetical protein